MLLLSAAAVGCRLSYTPKLKKKKKEITSTFCFLFFVLSINKKQKNKKRSCEKVYEDQRQTLNLNKLRC